MEILEEILKRRPAVHQLCSGSFLQEHLHLSNSTWAIPLQPLGMNSESSLTAQYVTELLGASVDKNGIQALINQGKKARPLVTLVNLRDIDSSPEELEKQAEDTLSKARLLLAWSSGEYPTPFAMVTATTNQTFFRLLPPHSSNRKRLGFGNDREHHEKVMKRLFDLINSDERFEFAVSMFMDALKETNPEFRIARFFACLESLTYRISHRHGERSRDSVRDLLGLSEGAKMTIGVDGDNLSFDRVELAGRIRAKLFHGVPFDDSELTDEARKAYLYLKKNPDQFKNILKSDCELEIARWANGASRGQEPIESGT
jgi:hypothetical protein